MGAVVGWGGVGRVSEGRKGRKTEGRKARVQKTLHRIQFFLSEWWAKGRKEEGATEGNVHM